MYENLKNIELNEQQAQELKLFLEDYKKKLTENIKNDLEKKYKKEQMKFFNEVKNVVSKKIKKILESKNKEIEKLKELNEQKMADLISLIQEKTEKKIIKENVENDPVYISFNKIKEIISPYINNNLPNLLLTENKNIKVKDNYDKIISFLKKKNLTTEQMFTILENVNLFEDNVLDRLNKKISELKIFKNSETKQIKTLETKKNIEKIKIKDIKMEKNNGTNKKQLKQKILESVIRNIDKPLNVVYKNFLDNKRTVFRLLNENKISDLYLILSEGKKKTKKPTKIKKPLKNKKIVKNRETIYTPENKEEKNENVINENKQTFDKFMEPLKRNINL